MTYYPELGFSSCEVAGAIAEAAVHDLRVNLFSFPGFPQIAVASDAKATLFMVTLSWKDPKSCSIEFQLSKAEAKAAVKKFKSGTGFDRAIFNRVQESLATLEGKASLASRQSANG